MKISYKILCEFVEGLDQISPLELSQKLSLSGLEVEEFLDEAELWNGIIVAKVLETSPHPNADKLKVCKVFDGKEELQIVCGAPNVTASGVYPLATLKTKMPDGLVIQKAKVRGVESHGMLCSAKELGLATDSSGLLELPLNLSPGDALSKALNHDDVILTLNITPNRGDALGHLGVAREVAALFNLKLKPDFLKTKSLSGSPFGFPPTQIKEDKACLRYTTSQIKSVKIKPSPEWLRKRLISFGQKSINNVVDATNYVMFYTGHPVHAFDAKIVDQGIVVDTLKADATFLALDETERGLKAGDLVIQDSKKILALAGIMGGQSSRVTETTTDLILEVAAFEAAGLRLTSKRLGLQTESSYRFARHVNPETLVWAHQMLQSLILEVAGGEASEILDTYPHPVLPITLFLTPNECQRILGIDIPAQQIQKILEGLGFSVTPFENGFNVIVGPNRMDITRAIDLVEEVGRIYGLNQIPKEMPSVLMHAPKLSPIFKCHLQFKSQLNALGFQETLHLSFGDLNLFEKVENPESVSEWVELKNPISEDLKYLRPTLLAHLLSTYKKNSLRTDRGIRFFEMRKIYRATPEGYTEHNRLTCIYGGVALGRNRFNENNADDFYTGKGWVESWLRTLPVKLTETPTLETPFHPGQSLAYGYKETALVRLGAVHPLVLQKFKIKDKVFAIDIDLDLWMSLQSELAPQYKAISPLPSVYRDLSIVADASLGYDKILKVLKKHKPQELKEIQLFDIFKGGSLPEGKVSLSFSFSYEFVTTDSSAQSEKVTALNDEVVNNLHFALVEKLQNELAIQLR